MSPTITPSSLALCASIGPRTQSPTAQTFSALGLAVVVDLDEAALVELHARAVGEQVLGERPAADATMSLSTLIGLLPYASA